MSDKIARLRAELALAELEDEFVSKKLAGELTADDRQLLREARKAYRENLRQLAANGAAPAAIGGKAEVSQ